MISPELLSILCCPETKIPVVLATPEVVSDLNQKVNAKQLLNKEGKVVESPFQGALITQDGKIAYPIRNGIPIMLIGEGILL